MAGARGGPRPRRRALGRRGLRLRPGVHGRHPRARVSATTGDRDRAHDVPPERVRDRPRPHRAGSGRELVRGVGDRGSRRHGIGPALASQPDGAHDRPDRSGAVVGEPRWPMAAAVLAAMVLTVLLPNEWVLGPAWGIPVVEGALLIALIVGDPGAINKRSSILRGVSIALVAVLIGQSLWSTARLIDDIITGGPHTSSASALLAAGSIVWVSNNIAFALLYWELDGGGAAARAYGLPEYPDLAFPQQLNPDVAPPGWRPRFVDYLYLGFTNATAFSPTDAMPLAPWAKISMAVQATISLAILGLVVARAVNVFT